MKNKYVLELYENVRVGGKVRVEGRLEGRSVGYVK